VIKFAIGDTVRMTDHARALFPWIKPPRGMVVTFVDAFGNSRQVSSDGKRTSFHAMWLEIEGAPCSQP